VASAVAADAGMAAMPATTPAVLARAMNRREADFIVAT
jgi:hypothetical protein